MVLFVNLLFTFIFVAFTYYYAKKSFTLTFLYGLVFYQAFSIIPSLIYIEEGVLINEQGRFSFFTGATVLCIVYFIITFIVIALSFKSFNKRRLPVFNISFKKKKIEIKLLIAIVLIAQGLLLFNALISPLPLFDSSVNRFSYWSTSKLPFLNTLFGNTGIFIPFALGVLFPKYKKFSVFMLIVFYAYNFMIGQKFSPIVSGTYSFLLPLVFYYKNSLWIYFKKSFVFLFSAFIILCGVMYFITYNKYEETRPFANIKIYDPNEAMLYRIFGLQGHLIWGATERYVVNETKPNTFNPVDLLYGMPNMMEDFAKDKKLVLSANTEGGYNFTNASPGIIFKIFPLSLALIAHTFFTIMFLALMGWILKEFMIQQAYLLSVIAYQIFNWTIYAFTMGYFYKLYFTIFFIIVYGFYVYFRKRKNEPKIPELQD